MRTVIKILNRESIRKTEWKRIIIDNSQRDSISGDIEKPELIIDTGYRVQMKIKKMESGKQREGRERELFVSV